MIIFIIFNVIKDICYEFSSLKTYKLIGSLYKYLGFAIFGAILYYISIKQHNDKTNSKETEKNEKNKLIYNKISLNFEVENKFLFFLICFFYILFFESIQYIKYLGFSILFIWTFDFISMFIFVHIFYQKKMYRHQKCSMLFIIIVDTALLIMASLIETVPGSNNKNKNIYQHKGISICLPIIFIFIFITTLNSFDRVKIKTYIDEQFVSPYQIIFLIGFFGFIINLIISIVILIKGNDCDNSCFKKGNIDDKCITFNCYSNISHFFGGEFLILNFMLIILYMISYFISLTCEFFIIKYLDPFHVNISDVLYFGISNLISFIKNDDKAKALAQTQFLTLQTAEVLAFIGGCVFLEIIELRCCELNTNLRKNITKRERLESVLSNEMSIGINDDDMDNNEDISAG
jgi:hypothetical protein